MIASINLENKNKIKNRWGVTKKQATLIEN